MVSTMCMLVSLCVTGPSHSKWAQVSHHLTTPPGQTAPPVPNTCPLRLWKDLRTSPLLFHTQSKVCLGGGQVAGLWPSRRGASSGCSEGITSLSWVSMQLSCWNQNSDQGCGSMRCRLCPLGDFAASCWRAAAEVRVLTGNRWECIKTLLPSICLTNSRKIWFQSCSHQSCY